MCLQKKEDRPDQVHCGDPNQRQDEGGDDPGSEGKALYGTASAESRLLGVGSTATLRAAEVATADKRGKSV